MSTDNDSQAGSQGAATQTIAARVPVYVPYMFLVPAIILLVAFRYMPAFRPIYHSFTDWTGTGQANFVGFAQVPGHDSGPGLLGLPAQCVSLHDGPHVMTTVMALIAAELRLQLAQPAGPMDLARDLHTAYGGPGHGGALLIWRQIYAASMGMLNEFLRRLGLEQLAQPWLGQPNTALPALIVIGFPLVSGFSFLVISAALMELSRTSTRPRCSTAAATLRRVFAIDIPSIWAHWCWSSSWASTLGCKSLHRC